MGKLNHVPHNFQLISFREPVLLKLISMLLFCASLIGCASSPQKETIGLSGVVEPKTIVIPQALIRIIKSTSWATVDFEQGLVAGAYVSEKENALGTFFRGPERAFFERNLPNGKYTLRKGGFWLPKDGNARPRLFYVFEPEQVTVDELPGGLIETTNRQTAASANRPGGEMAQAVGTGIGVGIVGAIIESDRGRLILLPELPNDEFVAKLSASAQSSDTCRGVGCIPGSEQLGTPVTR